MAAVRCIDLCRTYRQGDQDIKALDHVNLDIESGGFVCLSAPSGGGKTTLLNAIGGLDSPDSGEVWIAGRRIDNLSKGELAQLRLTQIGFVFQAYNLIPVLSARENVEFVMQVQGLRAAERQDKSMAILKEGGLQGLEDRRPAEMSGGQQQRVAIARGLAMKPEVMLFDEPTSALDPELVGEVLKVMRDLADEGRTMLVVTHEMGFARDVSSEVVFLHDGRIEEKGEPKQMFSDPNSDRFRQFLSRTMQ